MTLAYDSTNLDDIPGSAVFILYYINGLYVPSSAQLSRFANAHQETISVTPFDNAGDWLDVETGDAFPWQAPDWIALRRNAGHPDPGVYVQYDSWAATKTEFELRAIPLPRWWIALWDGQAILLPGADGKQYAADHPGTPYYSGGHYDLSVFSSLAGGGGGTITADMTDEQIGLLAQVTRVACMGIPAANQAELDSDINQIKGNGEVFFVNVYNDPRSVAYRAKIASIGQVPPPSASQFVPHKHKTPITLNTEAETDSGTPLTTQ